MNSMSVKKGFTVLCAGVEFSPPGQPELKILNGVDLSITQGEFVTIVGGNGTGKSTLLHAIAGEIERTAGTIDVGGRRIKDEPIHRRIDGVGIVHQQDDDDLLHAFSIAMNVAFRQANNGCHPKQVLGL
jgi:putative tryptophan/tyrosine transport system ATP-binding protein